MKNLNSIICRLAVCMAMAFTTTTLLAQTTANWIGPATGGEWNNGANWDTGSPPLDSTTNAFIGVSTNVNYNTPMAAASFGDLNSRGALSINAAGFNNTLIMLTNAPARLLVNFGGAVNVSGNLALANSGSVNLAPGGSVTVGGTLIIGAGDDGSISGSARSFGSFTNAGGTLNAAATSFNPGNGSIGTAARLIIIGGTNNLGALLINREPGGASSASIPAYGSDGMTISNGIVNTTSITLGNNAHGLIYMLAGNMTNTGLFIIRNGTATRPARFVQRGGFFVTTDPNAVVMQGSQDTVYSVLGGTNTIGGLQITGGTALVTNAASIFIGSVGIASNGAVAATITLNTGGRFAASTDWTNSAQIRLNGGSFETVDANGAPHNIYSFGPLVGAGDLKKIGGGKLILTAPNNFAGNTLIGAGTLALANDDFGSPGSIASILPIVVSSGAAFDVSGVTGFTLNNLQTLSGYGVVTGNVSIASGGKIDSGTNILTFGGTLSFSNSVTETGGAINRFDLSSEPNGASNDFINILGDFNASGANAIQIVGSVPSGTNYALIKYGGTFNGNVNDFILTGVTGYITNNTATKTISVVTLTVSRGPATISWVGNPQTNHWDTAITTNWLNAGALDYFLIGDTAVFDSAGAANPIVNVIGSVLPAAVVVNAATDYAFTNSTGSIDGTGGLTKLNTGTLSIQTTNNYTGVTTIGSGTVEVSALADGNFPSPIGASGIGSANLVISNGTLRYIGDTVSVNRGASLTGTNATINVTNSATTLTVNGILTGAGTLNKTGEGTLIISANNSYASTAVSNGLLRIDTTIAAVGSGAIKFAGGTVSMNVSAQQTYPNALNVAANSRLIAAGGNNNIVSGPWSGSGTLTLDMTSGGTFTINGNMTTNFNGTLVLADSSIGTFRFNAGGNGTGAQQSTGSPFVAFDFGNSSVTILNRNGGAAAFGIYDLGALSGGPSTILKGASNGGGPENATFYSIGAKNLNTTFAGTIVNGAGGAGATTAIIKVGSGKLTFTGANTYTGSTTVSNGVLALGDGVTNGSISGSASINIVAGASLDLSGRSDQTLSLTTGKTLGGNGTLLGSIDTTPGGTVAPGTSIGTLTVSNTATLGGTALMEIDRNSIPKNDTLVATNIIFGGTLVVTNIGGTLQVGDSFKLFSGALSGSFVTVVLPNYYTWNTTQLDSAGIVSVAGVSPLPKFENVDFSNISGGVITLNAINGAPNASVIVLTTTNLLTPLANWTPITTNTFDGSGNYSVGLNVNPAAPQQYFILKAP